MSFRILHSFLQLAGATVAFVHLDTLCILKVQTSFDPSSLLSIDIHGVLEVGFFIHVLEDVSPTHYNILSNKKRVVSINI